MPDEQANIEIDSQVAGQSSPYGAQIPYPDPPDFSNDAFNSAVKQFAREGKVPISGRNQTAFDDLVRANEEIARASFYSAGASVAAQNADIMGGNVVPVPPVFRDTSGSYAYSGLGSDSYGFRYQAPDPGGDTGLVPYGIPWQRRKHDKGSYAPGPTIDAEFRDEAPYIDSTSGGFDSDPYPYKSTDYYRAQYDAVSRKTMRENLEETFSQRGGMWGQIAIGAAVGQGLEATGRYYANTQAGQYLTPEQQATQEATVGAGAVGIAGTVIGAAVAGPPGAVVGGLVGSGVGALGSSVFGAYEEKQQSYRLTSEQLGAGFSGDMADASATVRSFREELENARTPIKLLADVVQTFQQSATGISPASLGSMDTYASKLGTFANDAAKGTLTFLNSSVSSRPAGYAFGLDPSGDLGQMSTKELAEWTVLASEQDDPNAKWLSDSLAVRKGGPSALADAAGSYDYSYAPHEAGGVEDRRSDFILARARASQGASEASAGRSALALEFVTGVNNPSLPNDLIEGTQRRIAGIDDQLKRYRKQLGGMEPGSRTYNTTSGIIYDLESQKLDASSQVASGRQARTAYNLSTSEANFNFGISTRELAGESYQEMQPFVQKYEGYLLGQANNAKNLTPAERQGLRQEGLELGYQNMMAGYEQTEGALGVGISAAQAGVTSAQSFGTPGGVQEARSTEIERLRDLQKQIGDELANNNLKRDDAIAKERELMSVTQQIAAAENQKQQDYYVGQTGIDDSLSAGRRALLPFGIAARGNIGGAGYDDAIIGREQDKLRIARQALADPKLNAQQRAEWQGKADEAMASIGGDYVDKYAYSPSARDTTRYGTDAANFQVAANTPWLDGVDSNPFSRGMTVIGDLQEQENGARSTIASIRKAVANGTWQGPPGSADQAIQENTEKLNSYRVQESAMQRSRFTAMMEALPEMVEGSPGGGVGVSITPFAAMSARFSPNPWMTGTWNHTPMPSASQAPTPTAGGSAGGFAATAESQTLQRIATTLDSMNSKMAGPSGGSPGQATVGPLTHAQQTHYLSPYAR